MRPMQEGTNTGRGDVMRGAWRTVVRAVAVGTGLVLWLFVAMLPVVNATAAVPSPLRLWLNTAAMAPIWLLAGAWIRRRYGTAFTSLGQALGPLRGLLLTAVLFALKHVVVDWSAARLTTLLTLSLVLGLVRWRWGTGASIATHVVMNLAASAPVLIASPGG